MKKAFEKVTIVRDGKPVLLCQQELRKPTIMGNVRPVDRPSVTNYNPSPVNP